MSMQALNTQAPQRRSSLLERYQPKTGSQDPMTMSASLDTHAPPSITKSTSQRSLQHSSLLQRYQPKPLGASAGASGGGGGGVGATNAPNRSSSQRSLDQSKLMRRYYHQPHSLDENQPPAGGPDGARLGEASATADQQRYSSQRSLENSKLLQRYNPTVNNSQEFTGLSVRESTPVARFNRGTSLEPERVQRSSLLSKYTPRFGKSLDRNQALEAAKGYGAGYGSEQHLPHQPAPERPVQSLASSRTEMADYGADHFDYYRDIRSRSSSLSRGGLAGRKGAVSARGSQRKLPGVGLEPTEPVTPETLPVVSAVAEPVLGNIASALPLPMLSVIPPTPAPVQQQQQQDIGSRSPFDGKTLSVTSSQVGQSAGGAAPVAQPVTSLSAPPVKPIRKDLQPGGKATGAMEAGAALGAAGGATASIVSIAIPTITTVLAAPSVKQSVSSEPPKEPSPPLFSTRDRMDHYGSASNPDPLRASNQNLHHPQRPATTTTTMTSPTSTTNTLQLPGINDMSSRRSMTDLRNLPPTTSTAHSAFGNDNLDDLTEFTDRAELKKLAAQRHQHPVKHGLANAFEQLAAFTIPQAIDGDDMEERIEALPPDRKLKRRDFTYHPTFVPKQNVAPTVGATLTVPGVDPGALDSRRSTASTASKQAENEEKRRQAAEEKRKREEERRQREADKRAHDEQERQRKEEERRRKEEEKRARDEEDRLRKEDERRLKEEEKRVKEDEKRRERDEKKRLKDEKKKTAAALKAAAKGGATGAQSTAATDSVKPDTAEEEMIDLASHLDHYSVAATMQTQQLQQAQQRSTSLGRPRSGGTPYGSQGALGSSARGLSNSFQSLDRGTSGAASAVNRSQSKLLQRYGPKAGSQEAISSGLSGTGTGSGSVKEHHRSQGSLDFRRSNRPSLLDKYTPRPLSASTAVAAGGQQQQQQQPVVGADSRTRSTSQRSLDSARVERSSLLQRYKPTGDALRRDPYVHRDHEYEPIGEPVPGSRLQPADGQQRKLSNSSFLRVPAGDEGDTVSMEELQKSIEDRFFNQPSADAEAAGTSVPPTEAEGTTTAPADEPAKASKMKAAMAKAQNSGKQAMAKAQESGKQAMAKAQEGGKTLQKKLMQQTDRFKTKMSNIKLKKDGKDTTAPLASPEAVTTPELEQLDFTLAVPKDEEEQQPEAETQTAAASAPESPEVAAGEEQDGADATTGKSGSKFAKLKNIHMPKIQKPDFKRPDFSKISKPKMPKLRGPDMSKFKRPEMPKFLTEKPDFGKMSEKIKLTRSKSMKEPSPSAATSAASPSDVSTLGPADDAAGRSTTKINYTDFSTYPRLFDKFKRQKSAPSGQASVRAGTPPPLEFTKTAKTTRAQGPNLVSRWTSEKSSEDAGSSRFLQYTGSELDERETSVERRMRQELERAEFEGPELLAVTEEQKQLEEYDKENREIHLLSAARHDEFMKRKPPMERQESDLASEEEKQFWASALGQKIRQNIDMNSNDLDLLDEEERLLVAKENDEIDQEVREQAQYLLELSRQRAEKENERRSSTPYTNQECQSSGSSSVRRRKGVLEEIDDDEFFLRQKGISKDNIQMGEYISSAIKEGLSHPKNALADMDRYDYYDEDADGLRRYYQPSFESDDVSNRQDFTDSYRTFPPDRPNRKAKSKGATTATGYDEENDLDRIETEEQDEELAYYDRQRRTKYGSEQPQQLLQSVAARYMDDEFEDEDASLRREAGAMLAGSVVPPTPPSRRRKKRFRDVTPSDVDSFANGGFTAVGKSISNNFIAGSLPTNVTVNRAEVPLAREESFGTIPEPAPRRSRSRSQLGSKILGDEDMDRVSRGAESLIGGIIDAAPGARGSYPYEVSENNGYATVRKEAPPRPPAPIRRRKSTRSLDAAPPLRQFNTLPSYNHSVSPVRPQRNYSTINPNRPPRRKSVTSLTGSQQQLKPTTQRNRDDGGQYEDVLEGPAVPPQRPPPPAIQRDVANKMKDRPLPPPPRPSRKPRRPDGTDGRHDLDGGAERVVSVDIEEVDTSTQTDPVSEDFGLDAEIAAVTEQAGASTASSRVNDADQLEGALHRFRDGNAKALSDRPKSSRSGSRPETPASILIERKVSTPSLAHESVVEASLTVQPLEEFDDDQYIAELVKKYVSEEARKPEPRRMVEERRLRKSTNSLGREEEIRPVETLGTSLRTPTIRSTSRTSVDGRLSAATPEPLRNVEISPTVIEEIVERLRTTEQHHIDELHKLHQQQLEDLRQKHEEQKRLQEQRLEEQQRQLLEQQSQQLHETQQLKEQILQQQEHQKMLLAQQQNQQQQLLVAQQQQQLLMEQQEKERELQREKERELLREREQELERARERERELHLARELELQRAREVEQQRARDLEQQRIREMELQRAREQEHQRLRELEIQRAIEAEQGRQRELELQQRAAQAAAAAAAAAAATPAVTAHVVAKETEAASANETPNVAQTQQPAEEQQQPATEASVDVVDGPTIATTTELSAATASAAAPPVRPPLPPLPPYAFHPDYLAYGIPPAAASQYLLRPSPSVPSEEDGMTPLAPQRRRRHLRSKRESTSEDDQHQQREQQQQQRRHRHSTRSPEPSIPSLGGQLVRACGNSLRQTGDDLMAMLRASSKDENKRDLHIAIIILIVIVAGLMALGMSGEKAVHHHHWDYFSPPGHGGA